MLPDEIAMIRHCLPDEMDFSYYDDRESPWLLAQGMPERALISDLRAGPLGRFVDRPLVKPMVAAGFGDVMCRQRLMPGALCKRAGLAGLPLSG